VTTKNNEKVTALESLWACGMDLSVHHQGKPCEWQEYVASMVFTKSVLNAGSLLRVTPSSRFCSSIDGIVAWDLCSVASIARNIIETYLTLHYFCQSLSDTEWQLRKLVWQFHEISERVAMATACIPNSGLLAKANTEQKKVKSALIGNPDFQKLPTSLQNGILKCRRSRLLSNEELCVSAGISVNYHKGMFKYLSNHTHTSPFSISDLDSVRTAQPDTICAFNVAVDTALGHTALALRDFSKMFQSPKHLIAETAVTQIGLWEGIFLWEKSSFYNLK